MSVPEVETVFGKAGRADTATDPAPLEMFETTIQLRPRDEWRQGMMIDTIIEELDARLQIPGLANVWVQPNRHARDRDVVGYVNEAREAVADAVDLPPGYSISWSGQFEYVQRADERLKWVVPATIGITFNLDPRIQGMCQSSSFIGNPWFQKRPSSYHSRSAEALRSSRIRWGGWAGGFQA